MFVERRNTKRRGSKTNRRILELTEYAKELYRREGHYSRAWLIQYAVKHYKVRWNTAYHYALEVENRLRKN